MKVGTYLRSPQFLGTGCGYSVISTAYGTPFRTSSTRTSTLGNIVSGKLSRALTPLSLTQTYATLHPILPTPALRQDKLTTQRDVKQERASRRVIEARFKSSQRIDFCFGRLNGIKWAVTLAWLRPPTHPRGPGRPSTTCISPPR